jgi:nickel-dependent lactate racemase
MIIPLPYGNTLLNLNLPDSYNLSIIEPKFIPAIKNPQAAIRESLQNPFCSPALSKLVKPNEKVGIIVNDITRPTPNQLILPEILAEIAHVPKRNILFFNALGSHRKNSQEELRRTLGDWIVDDYRIIQNDAFDPSTQICIGDTKFGHQIWLNRELLECDLKILTGFIEPHFFAGFSGGGKAIMPGMAGLPTILGNHSAEMIAHPNATWGVTQGNPIFEEINEIVGKIKNLFLINVALNKNKDITNVFSGDVREAHSAGCRYVKGKTMVPVQYPFDIVITTNSGFPLDINLYQSVKGMSAAAKVVKEGGVIIITTECRDGIPEHGLYGTLLRSFETPDDLLRCIMSSAENRHDQWQAQIQGYIQKHAKVYVYSEGLTKEQIHSALLESTDDIEGLVETLVKKIGKEAKICVLPEGPQTIPYVDKR